MVKKYLRLHDNLHLKQEFCIREKDGAYFYIIGKKEPETAHPEPYAAQEEEQAGQPTAPKTEEQEPSDNQADSQTDAKAQEQTENV